LRREIDERPSIAVVGDQWRAPIQTGAAAGLSWWIASHLAGHALPLSAPVVAVIAIGATLSGRWRRTMDVILGLSIGIGLTTLLVSALGRGALVLALVVTAAMAAARAASGGELPMMQAGAAAILIFAAPHAGSPGTALSRVLDALIGGGCAGLVSLVVLPPDPAKLLIPRIEALHAELAEVLDDIAAALRRQDTDAAAAALERARATSDLVEALNATRPAAAEIARLVPARRDARGLVRSLSAASVPLDHAIRNGRVYARATLALLAAEEPVREECASAARDLAEAVRRLDPPRRDHHGCGGVELARGAADRLAHLHADNPSLALGAVATASRGIADDLAFMAASSDRCS
jgi:uncharacterized membrane protein YgaE (UPF0421/DUF939 family)